MPQGKRSSEHKTPRDRYTVKKLPKNLWGLMWVSDRTPATNFRASVTFRVCILCGRRTGVPGERTTAGLLGIQTEPKQTWSRLPRASETSGLLSQVETFDKQAASGMWRGTLLHWKIIFSSAACIIKRAVVRPPTKPSHNKKSVLLSPLNKPNISRLTDANFIPATHIYKR